MTWQMKENEPKKKGFAIWTIAKPFKQKKRLP